MSLYALRKSPLGFSITKFDTDFNPEATYELAPYAGNTDFSCSCPAGHRPSCRHRLMLPRMLGHVGDGWFYAYETQKWHRPLEEPAPVTSSPSDHYGISPAASILPDVRAWNALPQEERIAASARHVEERLGLEPTAPAPAIGNIRRRV